MNRERAGWLLACVLSAAGGAWLGQRGPSLAPAWPGDTAPVVPTGPAPAAALPAAHTPLQQVHAQLAERAGQGDGEAAFRLASELLRCRALRSQRWLKQRGLGSVRDTDSTARDCLSARVCADVSPEHEAAAIRWLVIAAETGVPEARFQFVSGQFLSGGRLDDLEYAAFYRRHALAWAQELAESGHLGATLTLAHAYLQDDSHPSGALGQVVAQDRAMAAMLFQAAARVGQPPGTVELDPSRFMPKDVDALSADELEQASAAGKRWYEAHLQGRTAPSAKPVGWASAEELAGLAPECVPPAERLD